MTRLDVGERLLDTYSRYIGDPDRAVDVYAGFGLFFAGIALGIVGVVVFLWSATLPETLQMYAVREVASVAAALGLPTLLVGIVVLLPVDVRMRYLAALGAIVCLGAIGLFSWAYPYHWNVPTPQDYSAQGVGVYSLGLVFVIASTGAALVAHQVERVRDSRATEPTTAEGEAEAVTDEDVRADIERELEGAELSWGGIARKETRRLQLDTSAIDDIDRASLPESSKTTRESGGSVDSAVAELRGLQGGDVETASGESTDDQAAALQQLRQQQREQEAAEETGSGPLQPILDRIRALF